jgi:hypothetical protein
LDVNSRGLQNLPGNGGKAVTVESSAIQQPADFSRDVAYLLAGLPFGRFCRIEPGTSRADLSNTTSNSDDVSKSTFDPIDRSPCKSSYLKRWGQSRTAPRMEIPSTGTHQPTNIHSDVWARGGHFALLWLEQGLLALPQQNCIKTSFQTETLSS